MNTEPKPKPLPSDSLFEVCEERLVLSAQPLVDLLHASSDFDSQDAGEIEPHIAGAHAASGLNSVVEQFGLGGQGQTVAVIDSGIAYDHVALGQGYGPGYRVVGGWDFAESDDQPYDDGPSGFHGTHVAGVIGSDDPSNPGVAPEVDLVALRVFDDMGQGQLDWVENALRWVHDHRNAFENPITTVNISVGALDGGQALTTLQDELQQLYQDGIIVTASAGNSFAALQNTELSYPASSQFVLPVASVDASGQLSDFSQRDANVIAAPGEGIRSSVPDHVLGRDGRIDDFTTSSGTSMAAPYVAGASVLVRQALEMVGADSDVDAIWQQLRNTSDTIFDSITSQSYDRLNLAAAIESILPQDTVGNTSASAQLLNFATIQSSQTLDAWINDLQDRDLYRFTASQNGFLDLTATSEWNDSLAWSISQNGTIVGSGDLTASGTLQLIAGQEYELAVSSSGQDIGPGSLNFAFTADSNSSSGGSAGGSAQDLGAVEFLDTTSLTSATLSATAANDGLFSILYSNEGGAGGNERLSASLGNSQYSTQNWQDGELRLDLPVVAGQSVAIQLPEGSLGSAQITIANLVQQDGSSLVVGGTGGQENYDIDLRNGLQLKVGRVEYVFAANEISEVQLDAGGSGDSISVQGTERIESVELRPGNTAIENQQIQLSLQGVEEVSFSGGGNTDRIYMYDANTDDTLRAYPERAELIGVGYRFQVDDVSRIFVHATGGGEDLAYVYDSAGDDRLSARPQFTSINGDGFFNYVRGFERVYAYSSAGGQDSAALYDSPGSDRFSAAGDSVLISGPGFSSHVRGFEQVEAFAQAGGDDRATLYGTHQAHGWYQGADYLAFQEGNSSRQARGFETVETYQNMQPIQVTAQSLESFDERTVSPQVERDSAIELEDPTSDSAQTFLPELGIYAQSLSMSEWLEDRLYLPEEELMEDEDAEQLVLHEAFRQYGEST